MKRIMSLVCVSFLLCAMLCACSNGKIPPASLETTIESVTNITSNDNAATESEFSTETSTEPDTEPEILVSTVSPEQVLSGLTSQLNIFPISTVSMQVTLHEMAISDVQNAFLNEGYILASTTLAYGTNLVTNVMKSLDYTVTLIQTSVGSLHVLWEKADEVSTSPLYPDKNIVQGDVTLAQIGIARENELDNPMIGMCYVYRLADGTALIIDGGVNNASCAENLFRTLQKMEIAQDENGKYRITAWIFSHGHADHMGTFMAFSSRYADRTDLQYVMYSFPVGNIAPIDCDAEAFSTAIREAYPQALRLSPHAGLTYFFGNLSIHVLYAPELLYSPEKWVDFYNNTSLILRVETNGQCILHMGDAGEGAAEVAWNENNSTAFQSNMLQITHHGLNTGPGTHEWKFLKKIYMATDANIGLLPMGSRLPDNARNGRHTVLVGWGYYGTQVSFVLDKKDSHNDAGLNQAYYDQFVIDVAAGTAKKDTLFGYDGINTLKGRGGIFTYISSSETVPMATVFNLSNSGVSVISNQELALWLESSN